MSIRYTIQSFNACRSLLLAIVLILSGFSSLQAQVKGVQVETYYVADANDCSDTTGGRRLGPSAKTYRIYVELEPGSRIRKLFGDSLHPLMITSDSVFYNNSDRPSNEFGYEIQASWFEDNPTLALDSWLTLGMAAKTHKGVLKSKDTDGDLIAGTNNLGGTASIAGGLLVNNDPQAGVPLTSADGLMPNSAAFGTWVDIGFKDSGSDTTIFGADSLGNAFICYACALQQSIGVNGGSVDSNTVLVAQLTTGGLLNFKLNVTIEQPDGNGGTVLVDYVATDDSLRPGELVSPFLTYPLACGCNDPDYLEYSGTYTCYNPDSCKNLIVFGCMDSSACNYDPEANFNLPSLCCYPGYCNDLNIALVCPDQQLERFASSDVLIYPNPARGPVSMEVRSEEGGWALVEIFNAMGHLVYRDELTLSRPVTLAQRDLSFLPEGIYLFRLRGEQWNEQVRLLRKN